MSVRSETVQEGGFGEAAWERSLPERSPRGTWIAVVGPIGVGKSTLAALVARRTGAELVPERFGDNPFLSRFYEPGGKARWGFATEVAFLTQRVDQVREIRAV